MKNVPITGRQVLDHSFPALLWGQGHLEAQTEIKLSLVE